jgi:hypothetical protein
MEKIVINAATRTLAVARNKSAIVVSSYSKRSLRINVPQPYLSNRRLHSAVAAAETTEESSFFQRLAGEKVALAAMLAGVGFGVIYNMEFSSSNECRPLSRDSASKDVTVPGKVIVSSLNKNDAKTDCREITNSSATKISSANYLTKLYDVDWTIVVGRGTYGTTHVGWCNETQEKVVLKRISRKVTNDIDFISERNLLVRIAEKGGH